MTLNRRLHQVPDLIPVHTGTRLNKNQTTLWECNRARESGQKLDAACVYARPGMGSAVAGCTTSAGTPRTMRNYHNRPG